MYQLFAIALCLLPALHSVTAPVVSTSPVAVSVQDSVPIKVTNTLFEELTAAPVTKSWRDSGYYFQLNAFDFITRQIQPGENDAPQVVISFRASDPSGVSFTGKAVVLPFLDSLSTNPFQNVSRGARGQGIMALPQDLVFCPSAASELGFGTNEVDLPLFIDGRITGLQGKPLEKDVPASFQVYHFEMQ